MMMMDVSSGDGKIFWCQNGSGSIAKSLPIHEPIIANRSPNEREVQRPVPLSHQKISDNRMGVKGATEM